MKYSMTYKLANLARKRGYNFREETRPEVLKMQEEIAALGEGINFRIEVYPDGSWMAKSTNVDTIITGSHKQTEISDLIKDAIFTYYGVPPQYSKDSLLRNSGEPVTLEQRVHVSA